MLLEIDNITVKYGKAVVVEGVSLQVAENEVVSIVGANGAGKSTVLKALSGITRLASGKIRFAGQRIDRSKPYRIVELARPCPGGSQAVPLPSRTDESEAWCQLEEGQGRHQERS